MPRPPADPLDWPGFYEPNFTPVPDDFFDVLLPALTDAELRVLCYMMRRTFGFKKRSDRISLSQITGGIVKRDGERLDGGAGISKMGAARAINGLIAKGIILAERNRSAAHGDEPTTYTLRMAGREPVSPNVTPPVTQSDTARNSGAIPPVTERDTQETAGQETVRQEGNGVTELVKRRLRAIGAIVPGEE